MRAKEERRKNEAPEERKVRKAARKLKRRRKGRGQGRPIRLGVKNELETWQKKVGEFCVKVNGGTWIQ